MMPTRLAQLGTMLGSVSSAFRNVVPGGGGNLQAIDRDSNWIKPDTREALEARRYACICSIIVDRLGRGSGFLIANDLVMTNYHVVFDRGANQLFEPSRIKCRFNFFADDQYEDNEHDWISLPQNKDEAFVASSPTASGDDVLGLDEREYIDPITGFPFLDYAVLRLTSPVGKETGRTSLNLEVQPLGWISMGRSPSIGQKLSVFQFPERVGTRSGFTQQSLQTSDSKSSKAIANGLRVQYDASTLQGSSGSPVFDGTTLVGLHNAGRARGDVADNRFVPIDLVLQDLARKSPQLYEQLISTKPPAIAAQRSDATSGMDDRTKREIERRVWAAQILLDREQQNDRIQVNLRRTDIPSVHVNHITCREKDDEVDGFVERIKIGAAQTEVPADFIKRYLSGSSADEDSGRYWRQVGMTWPSANTPPEQVRDIFRNHLSNNNYASRTLVVLTTSNLAKRSPEEEYSYIKILGEECARYVHTKAVDRAGAWQAIQALVIHKVPAAKRGAFAQIACLWTESPPPHCGASLELPRVTRDDIEAWRINVNEAWKNSNVPIEFPPEFDPEASFYMAQVIEMLKGPITKAAIALKR
jgi:hypothetical protein